MNKKLPAYFLGKSQLAGTVIFSFLFAIAFLFLFVPFSNTDWTNVSSSGRFLFTVVFFLLMAAVLTLSRALMYWSKGWFQMTYLIYILWCVFEILVICVIFTVFTIFALGPDKVHPWRVLRNSFVYGATALIIPYIISGMYLVLVDNARVIRNLTFRRSVRDRRDSEGGEGRVSFYDTGGTLKLSVDYSNLYYIESDDNYIKVWFTDNRDVLQSRMIRCRLKTIEENFTGTSLVRCNRKYIVNIERVKVLSREGNSYILDMGISSIAPIEVTKTYQPNVLSFFAQK